MPKKPSRPMRDYANAKPQVVEFYRRHNAGQTLKFVRDRKADYVPPRYGQIGMWQMLEKLDRFKDDSDPDTENSQLQHALQTAEAIRSDGHPRWFVLTGLIHDAGKVLCLPREFGGFDQPQWAVVGDTFPVGCAFSRKIVLSEFFRANSDSYVTEYQSKQGIYLPHCGLDNVHFSWGHDEYLYQVVKAHLPAEALAMIRYHSAYVIHYEGGYRHLMTPQDHRLMKWVTMFSEYDLYTKDRPTVDVAAVRPFYQELIAEFLPPELAW